MAKRGRPQKPYQTSWNVPVAGLARDTDGRWRVLATGEWFRVARLTRIPRLANLASMDLPRPSLRLRELTKLYRDKRSLGKDQGAGGKAGWSYGRGFHRALTPRRRILVPVRLILVPVRHLISDF
jgi:hypothetical protein